MEDERERIFRDISRTTRSVSRALLAEFASLVILTERGVAFRGGFSHSRTVLVLCTKTWAATFVAPNPGCRRAALRATLHNLARFLHDHERRWRRRWRSVGGFGGVDAGGELALGDEGRGALLWDDLEVVGAKGVEDVDGRRRPVSEDDGPLLLSHGDVLGVVVPIIAEGFELAL